MALLELPPELFLEICRELDTRSFVRFNSTCRAVRQTLQGDNLSWLIRNYASRYPNRIAIIEASNRLVLSHVLMHMVYRHGYSRNIVQPLLCAGASFRDASCGEFLRDCIRIHSNPGRLNFALQHGASMGTVPCGLGVLLKETMISHGTGGRVRILLQHASTDEVTSVIDMLIAQAGDHPVYWKYVDFLTKQGGKLSERANDIFKTQTKWMADPRVNRRLARRAKVTDVTVLGLLHEMFHRIGTEPTADVLLSYATDLAQLSGGIHRLLEVALSRYAAVGLACYLIEQGACLRDVPSGMDNLLDSVLDSKKQIFHYMQIIDFLLEQGASLDRVHQGYKRHLTNLFLRYGPGPEVERIERDYGISLETIDADLDSLLETCIYEPGEPGPRVEFLTQRGATLVGRPESDRLLKDAFVDEGPGLRMELLLKFGAKLDFTSTGLNQFLDYMYIRFGAGHRVDWLLQQGAFWSRGYPPHRGTLEDYQTQLMRLQHYDVMRKMYTHHRRCLDFRNLAMERNSGRPG